MPRKPEPVCVWVDGRCPVCLTREYKATKLVGNPCKPNPFHKKRDGPTKRLRKPLPDHQN